MTGVTYGSKELEQLVEVNNFEFYLKNTNEVLMGVHIKFSPLILTSSHEEPSS